VKVKTCATARRAPATEEIDLRPGALRLYDQRIFDSRSRSAKEAAGIPVRDASLGHVHADDLAAHDEAQTGVPVLVKKRTGKTGGGSQHIM
jgi:hypothetical protein